jgi:hypothetical protein
MADGRSRSSDPACPVCLDPITPDDIEFLNCLHAFHTGCLRRWIVQRPSCPVCRTSAGDVLPPERPHTHTGGVRHVGWLTDRHAIVFAADARGGPFEILPFRLPIALGRIPFASW